MTTYLPPGSFLRSILLRTALVWAFVRAVASSAATGLRASGVGTELGPAAAVPILVVVVLVVYGDLHRRREVQFLRNLGVGPVGMLVPVVILAVTLEVVLVLTVGV
jgi:hypothetical protein